MGLWCGYDSWVIVDKLSEDENKKNHREGGFHVWRAQRACVMALIFLID